MSTTVSQQTVSPALREQLASVQHFIGGQYCDAQSGETFENPNPATGEILSRVALGGAADIDRAVKAAKQAFDSGLWPEMSMQERCEVLRRVGDVILSNKERLAQAETLDTGKPIFETLHGDIVRSASNFHFFASYAPALGEECFTSDNKQRHVSVREPLGVVGLITPWNLPLYLATWKLAPALAMGNTCVLKPAEWTPVTAYLLGELLNEAGLPPGVVNIVQGFGPNSAGEALTRHPEVKAISFTGETTTGKAIMVAASETLKKVSFELGGKGANVIFEDANLDEAIPTAVRAAFRNQGQICLAGSRLFVQQGVYEAVVQKLVAQVEQIKVGDPLDPDTRMGALISKEHMEKVQAYIKQGQQEGNQLTGGEGVTDFPEGNFIAPVVFRDVAFDAQIAQEEIFGPVLPVIPFDSEEQVLNMVNSSPYGLSASVWSQDVDRCHRMSQGIQAGMVWVNTWFARDLRTPFGGQKASGIGREGGRYSLDFFSEAKTISYHYH